MSVQLTFRDHRRYETTDGAITIFTRLGFGDLSVNRVARVDTGATVCLFSRELADDLGIDVESGHRIDLRTLAGSLLAY
jgi:hypothetical protein